MAMLFGLLVVVVWGGLFVGALLGVAYVLVAAALRVRALVERGGRSVSPRERMRAEALLREQYASGMLTLVGLEERLDDVLAARRGVELEHVLDDLPPPRRRLDGTAAVSAAAGVALLLFAGTATHAAGAAAVATVFLPRRHALVYALALGCGLLVWAAGVLPALLLAAAAVAVAVEARRFA